MLSAQLMKVAQNNQWQIQQEEQIVYGEYNGFLFSAMEGKGFKAIFTPIAGISQPGLRAIIDWLDQNTTRLKLRNYDLSDNFLCVRLNETWLPLSAEKIEMLLAQLSGMLDQFGLPHHACVICGQPATKRGLLYGLFCHLHPECQDTPGVDFGLLREESPAGSADVDFQELSDQVAMNQASADTPVTPDSSSTAEEDNSHEH